MIDLGQPKSATLARFVRDLDVQDLSPVERMSADLRGASAADLDAALLGWASRIVDEQGSVVALTELLGHLAALEAPYAALATVHRILGDELRHVRLCAQVASWFGDLETLAIDLAGLELPPRDEPRASRALEIVVRELVVGESESLPMLRAYRDATSDLAVRAAYDTLLFDEARHAAAGKHLSALLRERLHAHDLAPFLAREDAVVAADRAHMRALHRAAASGGPGRRYGVSIDRREAPPALAA